MRQKDGFALVEAFRLSGLTQKAWCHVHRISLHKLKYWISQMNKQLAAAPDSGTGFAPVQIDNRQEDARADNTLSITFPNGVKLECPANMPLSDIQSLIQTF